jgi:predicted amidophosphoribosyltransferase
MRREVCRSCQGRLEEIRGVCSRCYQAARYAIEIGETTDEELVSLGFWLPAYSRPRSEMRSGLADYLSRKKGRQCHPKQTRSKSA